MTLINIAKRAEKLVADNSPLILTAIGVTGTITTAYLTGKASYKAAELIAAAQFKENLHGEHKPLETRDKVEITWRLYLPAVSTGAVTVVCIVMANQIGTRRAAAMAAAYSISEKAFSEYKDKIIEKYGENKERHVRDEVAQDQVRNNPVTEREVIITGGGNVLCYEAFTGRYFHSDMESLKKAQNDLNYQVLNHNYASLSDFYDLIGLPRTSASEEVGWNVDKMLEIEYSTVLSEDGRPCISVSFAVAPVRGYYRLA